MPLKKRHRRHILSTWSYSLRRQAISIAAAAAASSDREPGSDEMIGSARAGADVANKMANESKRHMTVPPGG